MADFITWQMVFFFQPRWFRRLVRKYTQPISPDEALAAKQKYALWYMLLASNAVGIALYKFLKGDSDTAGLKSEGEVAKSSALYYAELTGMEKAQIVRYHGFQKIEDYEYIKEKNSKDSEEP